MKNQFRKIFTLVILASALLLTVKCTKDDGTTDNLQEESGTFVDTRDNTTYSWIKIGNQTWMSENLAYKTSSNSVACNDNESNVSIYGYLYSWETAQTVAPDGWHLPSQAEWQTLVDYLGGAIRHGVKKLLESGTAHWESPNTGNK